MDGVFHDTTISSPLTIDSLRFCSLTTRHVIRNNSASFYTATLTTAVIIAIFSPVAVVGNCLIMATISRNQSLRTPSYILLWGLAFTDIFTGLITQPFYVTAELICLQKPHAVKNQFSLLRSLRGIGEASTSYFSTLSIILITLMSIERWLHMTRRSFLTVRRTCIIVTTIKLLLIPLALFRSLRYLNGTSELFYPVTAFVIILVCVLITSIAYLNVYRVIRGHKLQINASELHQISGRRAISLAKYKKSVSTVLYILVVFYICYLPSVIMIGFSFFSYHHSVFHMLYRILVMFWLLSSSINPFIYLWRINDIRNGVKNLLKQLFCNGN